MNRSWVGSSFVLLALLTPGARAGLVFHTALSNFNAASTSSLVEDFESFTPKDQSVGGFTKSGISYFSHSDPLYVSSPGYTNFGVAITSSSVLTANGNEDFSLTLAAPATAIGFDAYLNSYGPAMVRIYGVSGLLGTYSLGGNPAVVGFFGVTSTDLITSVRWTTVNGRVVNTGVDNIRVGNANAVPEPSSLLPAALGAAGLGVVARRRPR